MADFTDEQLLEIIAGGESDRVEFKSTLQGDAPKRIREAICAFANDLPNHEEPGLAFVGVEKDGTLLGKPITEEMLLQLADMKTDGNIVPPPTLMVEKRVLQDKEVAIVVAQPSDSTPVRFKGTIQVRIGPRRGIATAQDERILNEKRQSGYIPFDIQSIPSSSITDLDMNLFNQYLSQSYDRDILEANNRSVEDRLAVTKMISTDEEPLATVLGLLVIGKSPQDFLPNAYVQFLRINGNNEMDEIVDQAEIKGTVADILNAMDSKLRAYNQVSVDILSEPAEKRREMYPVEALQQMVRNAVMHRQYDSTRSPILVYWFNDRIEIVSPGGPYGRITPHNFGEPRRIDYRNPNLAEAMKVMGFVERFGFGIPVSRMLLRKGGNPEPEFIVDQDQVMVIIKRAKHDQKEPLFEEAI